ncbi:diacylglycerol/lipid kinase family protein [Janibacter sp. G1551]|uniref:diacylglycerol/lipid kinase family protein n=1 Tax=Janibacter sp. G1551 TaxID=3420440 RepID=UPI003CFE9BD3
MRHLLVITNADAGSSDADSIEAAVTRLRRDAEVDTAATSDLDELRSVLQEVGDREVVIAGGDGSLHAAIACLADLGAFGDHLAAERVGPAEHAATDTSEVPRPPVLGLIPLGTGNDFARAVGIPLDPVEAAEALLAHEPTPVDLIVDDEGHVVVNAVHVGIGADANAKARPWKAVLGKVGLGALGYGIGALGAAVSATGWRLEVVADGEVLSDGSTPILQLGLANGHSVGGGTELAPEALPSDGRADLVLSEAVGPLARLRYGAKMREGRHTELPDVRLERVRHVRVRALEGHFRVNADGELSDPVTERTWVVRPGVFRLSHPPMD